MCVCAYYGRAYLCLWYGKMGLMLLSVSIKVFEFVFEFCLSVSVSVSLSLLNTFEMNVVLIFLTVNMKL